MKQAAKGSKGLDAAPGGGLAGWLIERLGGRGRQRPRLELLERIALAPRQTLALVEADGRRFLVATSAEGSPAFHALETPGFAGRSGRSARPAAPSAARVSW
jgi:flagellar biogenesis protein FliO